MIEVRISVDTVDELLGDLRQLLAEEGRITTMSPAKDLRQLSLPLAGDHTTEAAPDAVPVVAHLRRRSGKKGAQERVRLAPEGEAPTLLDAAQEALEHAEGTRELKTTVVKAMGTPVDISTTEVQSSAAAITAKEVADAITNLSRKKDVPTAAKVVRSFGVQRVSDLKPEQFADVLAAVTAALT